MNLRWSALITWNSNLSMVAVSLRNGHMAQGLMTRPPMVSKSSSLKLVPKYSLKSSIGVNALMK